MRDQGVTSDDLFTKTIPPILATEYIPTSYRSKHENWKGGLLGFVEKHPIASLLIGAAAVKSYKWITTPSSSGSYSSDSYSGASSYSSSDSCEAIKQSCFANCEQMSDNDNPNFLFRTTRSKCKSSCRKIDC